MRDLWWMLAALGASCDSTTYSGVPQLDGPPFSLRDANHAIDAVCYGPPPVTSDEAVFELDRIRTAAITYYFANGMYPQTPAAILPGAGGAACSAPGGRYAVVTAWNNDNGWKQFPFSIGVPNLFSYQYSASSATAATAVATGDLDCDTTLITYTLSLSVDGANVPHGDITEPPSGSD